MEWRLAKLAKLRQNNFGIKPDREVSKKCQLKFTKFPNPVFVFVNFRCVSQWRPDVEMYGNPQMMEIGDFLGGPIFENDDEKMAAIKTFVFTWVYGFRCQS